MIPPLRDEALYQAALRRVCPALPDDLRLE